MSSQQWQQLKDQSPVRIQWDPERDLHFQPQQHRAIQIGLGKQAVALYVNEWIRGIADITPLAREIEALVQGQQLDQARSRLPQERPYIALTGVTVPMHSAQP